jgi:hypothetical protein
MMPMPPSQLQLVAPQVDGGRQHVVQTGHDRGAGGGQAGHRLEEGVGEAHGVVHQQQGTVAMAAISAHTVDHQQEAVARLELAVVPSGSRRAEAAGSADRHAVDEIGGVPSS